MASVPALEATGGLTIPEGVTLNIYQAADNGTATTDLGSVNANQCVLKVIGAQGKAGITVEGTLQVYSGSLVGVGGTQGSDGNPSSTLGIDINGTATVGLYGNLMGITTPDSSAAQYSGNDAINISGSLTSQGSIVAYSGTASSSSLPIIGGEINGLENLNVNNGLVITSLPYNANTVKGTGGVWSQTPTPTNTTATTSTNTAFGKSTLIFTAVRLDDTDANLTVLPDANLTLANIQDGYPWNFVNTSGNNGKLDVQGTLNVGINAESSNVPTVSSYFTQGVYSNPSLTFGVSTPTTANGNLTIEQNGVLNIAENADVTMNASSTLDNSGTINVTTSTT